MKWIADRLSAEQNSVHSDTERDEIIRTAFNRYYYAIFLLTRRSLCEIGLWTGQSHSSLPDFLKVSLLKRFKTLCGQTPQTKALRSQETELIFSKVKHAIHQQADILEQSYNVRVMADYKPEIEISYKNHTPFLGDYRLSDLSNNYRASEYLIRIILDSYQRLSS